MNIDSLLLNKFSLQSFLFNFVVEETILLRCKLLMFMRSNLNRLPTAFSFSLYTLTRTVSQRRQKAGEYTRQACFVLKKM